MSKDSLVEVAFGNGTHQWCQTSTGINVDVANVTEPTDTKYLPLALHMKGFKPHLILQPLKSESLQRRVEWTRLVLVRGAPWSIGHDLLVLLGTMLQ